MIRLQELRIGNLLLDENKNTFHEVTNLYKKGGSVDYHYPLHWYKPIPLTPEILEKCGFEKQISNSYSSGTRIEYNVYTRDYFTYNGIQEKWWYDHKLLMVQPKYLHQLQNLYFALTGEELIFKP